MLIKLVHCKQTDSRRRNWTQQEEDNNPFSLSVVAEEQNIFSNPERLKIICCTNTSMLSAIVVVVVMTHCGVQRSKARGRGAERWRHPYTYVCGFAVHMFSSFSTLRPGLKKCVYRIHVDDRPNRCKTCAFTHKSASMRMAQNVRVQVEFCHSNRQQ